MTSYNCVTDAVLRRMLRPREWFPPSAFAPFSTRCRVRAIWTLQAAAGSVEIAFRCGRCDDNAASDTEA